MQRPTLCSCELNSFSCIRTTISSFDVHGAARRAVEYVGCSTVSAAPVAKVTNLRQYQVNLTPHTALHYAFYTTSSTTMTMCLTTRARMMTRRMTIAELGTGVTEESSKSEAAGQQRSSCCTHFILLRFCLSLHPSHFPLFILHTVFIHATHSYTFLSR